MEAPYRKVDKGTGHVTDEVVYMTADVEDEYIVAQANEPLDENGYFVRPRVSGRHRNDIQEIRPRARRLHGCFSANDGFRRYRHDPVPRERRL